MLDSPDQILVQALIGLSTASTLFLLASGLSIIFGVTRIVNFAHGSFYMLGAYLANTFTAHLPYTPLGYWGGILLAALAGGLLGVVMEVLVMRRIYRAPELFQILATFGVVLVVENAAQVIWGPEEVLGNPPPGLDDVVEVLGQPFPQYDFVLIAIGPLLLGLLWWLFHRTAWGLRLRAATQDRQMAASLGVNEGVLFTSVMFVGCFLGALAGALQIPKEAANLQMSYGVITETFVVVVVGGMGSVAGAALAALLLGMVQAFGIVLLPQATMVLFFVVMAVVLVLRPQGLLGRKEKPQRVAATAMPPRLEEPTRAFWAGTAAAVAALLLLPLVAGEYTLLIVTEIGILAVFAASLHFIMGPGGMVSFGHAAYYGLGAYGAAVAALYLGLPMGAGLGVSLLLGGLAALVFGWFCVRLSGVYLAMLTLAFAQIVWSLATQWVGLTGGDNGILGIARPAWLESRTAFYLLAVALCTAAVLLLRLAVHSPFGWTIRAGRDSALRAGATGIDLRLHQWLAFALSGAAAGFAGGLAAYQRGNVFPSETAIPMSLDGLVMVLLGGVNTLLGPVVGAATYHAVRAEMIRGFGDWWRLVLGLSIILLVVLLPRGLVGGLAMLRREKTA